MTAPGGVAGNRTGQMLRLRRGGGEVATRWSGRWLTTNLIDLDLLVLLLLIVADIRVFRGNLVASFTLYELFAWFYCAPYVIGHLLAPRNNLPPLRVRFIGVLAPYLGWLLVASTFAALGRHHSDVAQQAKNVLPALPLAWFLAIRLAEARSVARLANLYVAYCCVAGILAIAQVYHGGPYFRPPIENNDYKLDFVGNFIGNVALGFSSTPNELAIAVLPGVMFTAVKLLDELRELHRPRFVTLLCGTLTGTALLLAQSRGALVWFVFGLAAVAGPIRRSRSFALKFATVAGLIVLLTWQGMSAISTSPEGIENTIQSRFLLWQTSFAAMISDPYIALLGDGMAYVQKWSWKIAGWEFPDAHNGWIDQGLFFGVPALLLYLTIWKCFFGIVDAAVWRTALPHGSRVLLDGVRGSVLAFMGLYFFEPVAHAVFPVSQLFLLMSCGVALASMPPSKPLRQKTLQNRFIRWRVNRHPSPPDAAA